MGPTRRYDPSAIGSDMPRSRTQYLARQLAAGLVAALRLNRPGFLATEIVQQISPIYTIPTSFGGLRCRCGHGRLRWRAKTFYTEEPQTIAWLESLGAGDCLWDIGANVGLYAIYAAKATGCRVLAIEPEAQNYALLLENIVLNRAQDLVDATNLAIAASGGLGRLHVHALTKGGAYNQFARPDGAASTGGAAVTQLHMGVSLDELVAALDVPPPTHLKIDVDGNEPAIIAGGSRLLADARCRSVLIELQRNDAAHRAVVERLQGLGFRIVAQRSNWESRSNREREDEHPAVNVIFQKGEGR